MFCPLIQTLSRHLNGLARPRLTLCDADGPEDTPRRQRSLRPLSESGCRYFLWPNG